MSAGVLFSLSSIISCNSLISLPSLFLFLVDPRLCVLPVFLLLPLASSLGMAKSERWPFTVQSRSRRMDVRLGGGEEAVVGSEPQVVERSAQGTNFVSILGPRTRRSGTFSNLRSWVTDGCCYNMGLEVDALPFPFSPLMIIQPTHHPSALRIRTDCCHRRWNPRCGYPQSSRKERETNRESVGD